MTKPTSQTEKEQQFVMTTLFLMTIFGPQATPNPENEEEPAPVEKKPNDAQKRQKKEAAVAKKQHEQHRPKHAKRESYNSHSRNQFRRQ